MSALRPLFAAAGVLLLVAIVMLGIRSTDDQPVPTTDGTTGPVAQPTDEATGGAGPTEGDGRSPSDDTACGIACGDDTTEPAATATDGATATATDGATDGGSSPSDTTACGIACGDDGDAGGTGDGGSTDTSTETSTDGGTTGSSTGTTGSSDGDAGSSSDDSSADEDDRTVVAIGDTSGDVDDMPDTGGGTASVIAGALAVAAGAGLRRRR